MKEEDEWQVEEKDHGEGEKDSRFVPGGKKNNASKTHWDRNYFKGLAFGNSVTGGVRRSCIAPAAYRRLVERKSNLDIEQHCITDYHASHKFSKNNKNPFPIAVSIAKEERIVCNLNATTKNKKKRAHFREAEPKLIQLSEIDERLYLCNLDALEGGGAVVSACQTIINLTSTRVGRGYDSMRYRMKYLGTGWGCDSGTIVFQPKFKDVRAITFGELRDLIRETSLMIERGFERGGGVLIVCETGINKAPSVAIGYAITRLNWTYDGAVDYIDALKLQQYDNWDNLTDVRLKNCLRALAFSADIERAETVATATATTQTTATTSFTQ